jgi:hypothetical protein
LGGDNRQSGDVTSLGDIQVLHAAIPERCVTRLGDLHQAPVVVMSEFAHDILESRLLNAIRRINMRKREAIVLMIEGLGA